MEIHSVHRLGNPMVCRTSIRNGHDTESNAVEPPACKLNRPEVIVNHPTFDERTLVVGDNASEPRREPPCEAFGEELAEAVHQGDRSVVLKRGWCLMLPEEDHECIIEQVEAS
jgi:hypothetical protein